MGTRIQRLALWPHGPDVSTRNTVLIIDMMNVRRGRATALRYKHLMSEKNGGSRKDSHYARLRRAHRERTSGKPNPPPAAVPEGLVRLYGLHTVRAALDNPARVIKSLKLTRNAAARLEIDITDALPFAAEITEPKALDALCGADTVHQGVVLEADPLQPKPLAALGTDNLVLVLDQVTDPHNVGAIMRSAVAFDAGAIVTTARHSPSESGVLAKAASGALEHIDMITVRNLAEAIGELNASGFQTVGLDSDGPAILEKTFEAKRIALVLGAEGKGLRQKTRETVSALARLDMPGAIRSLNVSNAAAISLYIARSHLGKAG